MSAEPYPARNTAEQAPPTQPATPLWRKAIPYVGTLAIFALIFWRIPIRQVLAALGNVPILSFVGVFMPFSIFYWLVDSYCLTWVIRRFNAPLSYADIIPIRASMYLLSLINTNLGQGGVAYYIHRKAHIPFLELLSSILFIALLEVYQLFLFSTLGVIFYSPTGGAQVEIVRILRVAYIIAWAALFGFMAFFAAARGRESIRS
ncbi:MAG TPA: hypothetical protein VEF03_12920, partial [Candidatus Binataceae bacterium]|nr:hypothetical protein [Candidatus Binataceae bacterium]